MRVIQQLIDHLRGTGHLTGDQLAQLQQMGLLRDKTNDPGRRFEDHWGVTRGIGSTTRTTTPPSMSSPDTLQ
jgi:hypothetical protein